MMFQRKFAIRSLYLIRSRILLNPQNLVIISILIIAAPFLISTYLAYRRVKQIERYLPDFLRDVAESNKSGMPLIKSIDSAAKGNYGALTTEMQLVSAQLSWGIPLEDSLKKFMHRVESKFVRQAVLIIIESHKSGGEIASILETVSMDIQKLKEMEGERKSKLQVYVYSIYMIFLLFLGIILVLSVTFVPATPELANVAKILGGGVQPVSEAEFITLFFHLCLIEAVFAGLISGQMGEGRVISGVKHSVILVIITMIAFSLFITQTPFEQKVAQEIVKTPPGTTGGIAVKKSHTLDKDVSSIEIVEEVRKIARNPQQWNQLTPQDISFKIQDCEPCRRAEINVKENSIIVNKPTKISYEVRPLGERYIITIGGG